MHSTACTAQHAQREQHNVHSHLLILEVVDQDSQEQVEQNLVADDVPGDPKQASCRPHCGHGVPDVASPALPSQGLEQLHCHSYNAITTAIQGPVQQNVAIPATRSRHALVQVRPLSSRCGMSVSSPQPRPQTTASPQLQCHQNIESRTLPVPLCSVDGSHDCIATDDGTSRRIFKGQSNSTTTCKP